MDKSGYSVIYTVVNSGFADDVVVAAREAGAKGGTIVHARGTGDIESAKFFGIHIEPEKEIVIILTENSLRHDIMTAIYKKAGLTTSAAGFTFSMPADEVLIPFDSGIKEEKQ